MSKAKAPIAIIATIVIASLTFIVNAGRDQVNAARAEVSDLRARVAENENQTQQNAELLARIEERIIAISATVARIETKQSEMATWFHEKTSP